MDGCHVLPKMIQLDIQGDQFQMYIRLSKGHSYSFLFESLTGPDILAETSVMGFDPVAVLKGYADRVEIVRGANTNSETIRTVDPLGELKRLLHHNGAQKMCNNSATDASMTATISDHDEQYRYLGGAVGVVNYDAVRLVEEIPDRHGPSQPLMEFGIYNDGIIYDNKRKRPFYFHYGDDDNRFDRLQTAIAASRDHDDNDNNDIHNDNTNNGANNGADNTIINTASLCGPFSCTAVKRTVDMQEYASMINKAKEYIHDGDIFQVVLSRRFDFDVGHGDTLALYAALRRLNPSPYMYHLRHGAKTIIGASPEMLVRITGDRAETFPIAGTRKVTQDEAENKRLAQDLLCDKKELAEHTMLVDLGRNDIGKICRPGTVRPESLLQIKRFSHVQHIVTHIVGGMDPDKDMFDAFRAVFPAGTVSGAPKVRAMEIIDELEKGSRGPYAGAVGYFSYNGCCDFAIAIRNIFIDGTKGFVQAGAGIVSDSDPGREFQETEHKAGAMLQALQEATAMSVEINSATSSSADTNTESSSMITGAQTTAETSDTKTIPTGAFTGDKRCTGAE